MVLYRNMIILFALCSSIVQANAQIKFHNIKLDAAKELASEQNKFIFMDFRAAWCKPCLEMEKEAFSEPSVGDIINKNYIPIKIDVDFFDGMDLQELYNVSVLPTILIINSAGVVQNRLIGKKDAYSLITELGYDYNNGGNVSNNGDNSDTVEDEPEPKKECFLKRWWQRITGN